MTTFDNLPRYRYIGQPHLSQNSKLTCFLLFTIAYIYLSYTDGKYISMIACLFGVYYTGYSLLDNSIKVREVDTTDDDEPPVLDTSVLNTPVLDTPVDHVDQATRDLIALKQLKDFANKIKEQNINRRNNAIDDELPPLIPIDTPVSKNLIRQRYHPMHLRQAGEYAPSAEGTDI